MSRYVALLLMSLFVVTGIKAQNISRSAYFAGMPFWESPIVPFQGEYPLTKTEAEKRINTKFDYDAQNRIVQVSVRVGTQLKPFEGFFGNLYINAPLTKVSYGEKEERHHFFDIQGNQISVLNSVYEKVYTKDRYGRNTSLTYRTKDGGAATDQFDIQQFQWVYEEDGSISEIRTDAKGEIVPLRRDFQFLRTRITYGPDGQVNMLQNIDEKGKLVNAPCGASTLKYFYDQYGRFERWEVYNKDGQVAIGPSSTAGEYNVFDGIELTGIVFFNQLGNPATHWSGAERWGFTYDQFGNKTSLRYLDAEGKPKLANRGYAGIQYEWDDTGRFLNAQIYIGVDGKPMNHPSLDISTIKYKHNDEGLVIETTHFNDKGELTNRKDNKIATVKYVYDDQGKLIATKSFNVKGKEIVL
ncbi:MAG: hypothetical protein KDC93_09230 [Cyclobacteriaceae bacterium]|nr:hypothetical protein [Cyclobacteriaceae bacterium]